MRSSQACATLGREPPAAGGIVLLRVAARRARDEILRLDFLLDPERGPVDREHARGDLDAAPQHLVGRLGGGELAAHFEKRVRDLGGLHLLPVEARLLQGDGQLVRERREQALAVLVHLRNTHDDPARDAVLLDEQCREALGERLPDGRHTIAVDPERRPLGLEESRCRVDGERADVVERMRLIHLVRKGEQRFRTFRLAPLLLVEPRVLERDRRLSREHLEQAHVVLVELVDAELRDHDRAGDARAVAKRDDGERLLDVLGARDAERELALERVRDQQCLAASQRHGR